MAHDVFICHSAEDRGVALAACAKLEANRIRCWIAPRDPIAGIPYARQLVDAIGAARIILLILSRSANNSEHVLRELDLATDRNKIVIPLRTEDVRPTGDLVYYIQRVHWLDAISPPLESRLDELVILARHILDASPDGAERSVPEPPLTIPGVFRVDTPTKRDRPLRLALIASSIVVALGLAIVVDLGIRHRTSQVQPIPSPRNSAAVKETVMPAALPTVLRGPAHISNCETIIDDPKPPTNVRNAPSPGGLVLTTLPNHTKLTVTARDHGWSQISSPISGWVFSSLTTIRCD